MTSTKLLLVDINNKLDDLKFASPNPNDEDEDSFYDAIDPDGSELKINVNTYKTCDENELDEADDDENKLYFFDTVTSRHTSDSSLFSPLSPKNLNFKSSNHFEDIEFANNNNSKKSNVINDNLKINDNVIEEVNEQTEQNIQEEEDEDDIDAELETAWSFWIDRCVKGTTKNEYEAGLKLLHTVKTVQNFWSVYNNIPDVSDLPNRYSYHLMRNTRRPLWEDKENSAGGLWKFKCKKEDTSLIWREVLLAAIGEQLSDWVSQLDDIVGVSVGRRETEDIVQIWNLDHKYEKEAKVCQKIQQLVPDVKFSVIFYKPHSVTETYEQNNGTNSSNNFNSKYHNNNNNNASKKNYYNQNQYNNLNTNGKNYNYKAKFKSNS